MYIILQRYILQMPVQMDRRRWVPASSLLLHTQQTLLHLAWKAYFAVKENCNYSAIKYMQLICIMSHKNISNLIYFIGRLQAKCCFQILQLGALPPPQSITSTPAKVPFVRLTGQSLSSIITIQSLQLQLRSSQKSSTPQWGSKLLLESPNSDGCRMPRATNDQ